MHGSETSENAFDPGSMSISSGNSQPRPSALYSRSSIWTPVSVITAEDSTVADDDNDDDDNDCGLLCKGADPASDVLNHVDDVVSELTFGVLDSKTSQDSTMHVHIRKS